MRALPIRTNTPSRHAAGRLSVWLTLVLLTSSLALSQRTALAGSGATVTPNSWATVAHLLTPRWGAAVVADHGLIYAIGGRSGITTQNQPLKTAEVYNPAKNKWTAIAPMTTARSVAAAATGPDGTIYVMGGTTVIGQSPTNTVEAFDPKTGGWTSKAHMPTARYGLAATTGPDGLIYAIGGAVPGGAAKTVEAYDPKHNTWSTKPSLSTARSLLSAVTTPSGAIWAIGGSGTTSVESYNVKTKQWSAAPQAIAAVNSAAVAGPDGRIYTIGGNSPQGLVAEEDFGLGGWSQCIGPEQSGQCRSPSFPVAQMPTARQFLGAAVGADGRIYAVGGYDQNLNTLNTVEAYTPYPWTLTTSTNHPAALAAATLGPDGLIYVAGGLGGSFTQQNEHAVNFFESYDGKTGAWTDLAPMPTAREQLALAAGKDGTIYAIGGRSIADDVDTCFQFKPDCTPFDFVEAYNPRTGVWTCSKDDTAAGCAHTLAPLPDKRMEMSAVTGADGKIYVLGGFELYQCTAKKAYGNCTALAPAVDVYTPKTNTWSVVSSLPAARYGMIATLGKDGKIYALGGYTVRYHSDGTGYYIAQHQVDVFDPKTRQWGCSAGSSATAGTISAVTVAEGGSGYTSAPTVTFSAPPAGGTTAAGTADVINGAVTDVTITDPGSGYKQAPTVGFSGGGGSGASAASFLDPGCTSRKLAAIPTRTDPGLGEEYMPLGTASLPDGKIYLMQRGADANGNIWTYVDAYNPARNTWTEGTAGALEGESYVPSHGTQWTEAAPGPDGKLYRIGGFSESGEASLNLMEAYTPGLGS